MHDAQLDALLVAAEEGVDCDGLVAVETQDGYVLEVDGDRSTGLDGAAFRSLASNYPEHVANWHFWESAVPPGEDRRAFLRWIEGADETPLADRLAMLHENIERTWGQLHITAELAPDGQFNRIYTLRHVDDVVGDDAVAPETLTEYHDPLDARELSKLDDGERYRPLKTAPSLQRGWQFPHLTADDLVRAVECFYPATIPNWHREREDELDVDHWRDTAERQTGIYEVVEELPRDAVEWVAEACCVDSQCTKRREWQYDADDELSADGGDGAFPCREPCSLVVAAARKWAILENESERTYEFELTPSEKNQLEELIDAVADGRIDEIREADVNDGANRYRARYLRAKRFDDEGNLSGVSSTDGEDA